MFFLVRECDRVRFDLEPRDSVFVGSVLIIGPRKPKPSKAKAARLSPHRRSVAPLSRDESFRFSREDRRIKCADYQRLCLQF